MPRQHPVGGATQHPTCLLTRVSRLQHPLKLSSLGPTAPRRPRYALGALPGIRARALNWTVSVTSRLIVALRKSVMLLSCNRETEPKASVTNRSLRWQIQSTKHLPFLAPSGMFPEELGKLAWAAPKLTPTARSKRIRGTKRDPQGTLSAIHPHLPPSSRWSMCPDCYRHCCYAIAADLKRGQQSRSGNFPWRMKLRSTSWLCT